MLVFDEARQGAFARLSGDYNPLHMAPDQARRSQFGGCVVHGVHLVLAALDALPLPGPSRLRKLEAQFRSAVMVGESVTFTPETRGTGEIRIAVSVGTQVRTVVVAALEPVASIGAVAQAPDWPTDVLVRPDMDELVGVEGKDPIAVDGQALAALFPSLAVLLSRSDAAAMLGVTRVVGMQCPGHWALFRQLLWQRGGDVPASGGSPGWLHYCVPAIEKRFSMVKLAMDTAGVEIRAEVLVRQPPPSQMDFGLVRSRVAADEFRGVRALIVGGSRGLGELAAKILAAGGAQVLLTYRTGAEDAARVAAELGGGAQAMPYAAEAAGPEALARIRAFAPTHLAYFATPIIAKRPPKSWDPATFERFLEVYAGGLSRLLAAMEDAGALQSVFFPSTTFIDDQPAGFAEYIAAKLAGEALCAAWQRVHPGQRIVVERMPPLVTDQTSARLQADPEGNLAILLPLLAKTQL